MHPHPHTCTQTHYKYMHYWWWIGRKDKKGNDKSVFWRQVFRLDLKQETDMECLTESGRQFWFIGQTDAVKGSLPRVVLPKLERGRSEDPDHIHTVKMSRFVNTSSKHNPASTSHKYKAGSQFWTQLSINSSGGSGAGVGGGGGQGRRRKRALLLGAKTRRASRMRIVGWLANVNVGRRAWG